MFNKKLISTVLSALTLFPTAAPLVSANGSRADAQPQPPAASETEPFTIILSHIRNLANKKSTQATEQPKPSVALDSHPDSDKDDMASEIEPFAIILSSIRDSDNTRSTQATEQPQPSTTTPSSAPETADAGTVPPAQKRPRQTEPQTDTTATAARDFISSHHIFYPVKQAYACLNMIDYHLNKFRHNARSFLSYISSDSIEATNTTKFSTPINEMYTCLGELISHLNNIVPFLDSDRIDLENAVKNKLTDMYTIVSDELRTYIRSNPELNSDYATLQTTALHNLDLFNPRGFSSRPCDSICLANDLFVQKNLAILILLSKAANFRPATAWALYSFAILNIVVQDIRHYFAIRGWNINKPDGNLTRESACKHLKNILSYDLQSLQSTIKNTTSNPISTYMLDRLSSAVNLSKLGLIN